mmetsp:Transcript_4382/g.14609  ORF Transcript_4382/g.14609 Transcript_4382/m.14609 type:complete len:207 (+) Transcript_4382:846-1466(+)
MLGWCGRTPLTAHSSGTEASLLKQTSAALNVSSNGKKNGWSHVSFASLAHKASVSIVVGRASLTMRLKSSRKDFVYAPPAMPSAARHSTARCSAGAPPRRKIQKSVWFWFWFWFLFAFSNFSARSFRVVENVTSHESSVPDFWVLGARSRKKRWMSRPLGGFRSDKSPVSLAFSERTFCVFCFAFSAKVPDTAASKRSSWSHTCPT